jgi:hypothetical protein
MRRRENRLAHAGLILAIVALAATAPALAGRGHDDDDDGPCSRTASAVFAACRAEITDDYWIAIANCINGEGSPSARAQCRDEAREERAAAADECREQREARNDLCDALGQERYAPDFDPGEFQTTFDNRNPYWPLAVGNSWVYEGGDETITVEVLNETKLIEGVTCIVVNDLVAVDGEPVEDTDDWYAQAINGDVWYAGEISQDFELFAGDNPQVAELVEIEGSWKTGRDDALPGVVMFGDPVPGTVYRQEISLGNAEDAAEIVSDSYCYDGDDPELDDLVPQELADLLCGDCDCVVTREFTPIAPGVDALKYYSPLVGLFLEVEEGEIVRLTECNVDPVVCAQIP